MCLLGSGNWGSAVAKILGTNAAKYDTFETEASCQEETGSCFHFCFRMIAKQRVEAP